MLGLEKYEHWVLFSQIPDNIKAKYSISGLYIRPFGLFEDDLNVDFNQKAYPHLVTQILKCCTENRNGNMPNEALFWDLTIGKRIECLLIIATLDNSSELSVRFRCLNDVCRQQMELEISMKEFASLQHQIGDTDHFTIQVDDESLRIRKPTGRDQLKWLKLSFTDEDAAAKAMIRTLILDDEKATSNEEYPIPDRWVKTINEAMEEVDPLVNFSISTSCPYCGEECHCELNLEELSLQELHQAQLNLLQTVHRLASYYHWSEQQIFSLPSWRRSHYLTLIEKEENR